MATTKVRTVIWSAEVITADTADETSSTQAVLTGYGAIVLMKVTNGSTGPTIPGFVAVDVSPDGGTTWHEVARFTASEDNDAVVDFTFRVPVEVDNYRLRAGGNTVTDITIDADEVEVTAV